MGFRLIGSVYIMKPAPPSERTIDANRSSSASTDCFAADLSMGKGMDVEACAVTTRSRSLPYSLG